MAATTLSSSGRAISSGSVTFDTASGALDFKNSFYQLFEGVL